MITTKTKVESFYHTFGSVRMRKMPKIIREAGYNNGMKIIMSENFLHLDDESKKKVFSVMKDCVKYSKGI